MMSKEANIRAILECNFTGFKDEIIDTAVELICDLECEPITSPSQHLAKQAEDFEEIAMNEIDKARSCEDCISREDILKSFKEIKFYTNHKGMRIVQLVDVIDCVFDAPSVQPQKKGHWIKKRGIGWECSVCNEVSSLIQCNFCPECGADMRGDSE